MADGIYSHRKAIAFSVYYPLLSCNPSSRQAVTLTMRFLLLLLLPLAACSGDATRVRIVNNTAFNLEDGELSFGSDTEEISFLAPGDESRYFRFNGADDCNRVFTAELQSFGSISSDTIACNEPMPIAPGKYSLVLAFEPSTGPGGTMINSIFLRLRED